VSNLEKVLARLDGVKKCGDGYMACCPGHDDKNPSLSLKEKNGKALLHCFAGCSQDRLNGWLNSENSRSITSDKYSQPAKKPELLASIPDQAVSRYEGNLTEAHLEYLETQRCISREVAKKYRIGRTNDRYAIPIEDEAGKIVDIRLWKSPEQRGENEPKIRHYEKGRGGARLFPIDQLKEQEIVVCEGETDALACITVGRPAITATCGAGTWPDSLSASFQDKSVIILTDNDESGRKGKGIRCKSLLKAGTKVKVATWPEDRPKGWDITDEIKEYGPESLLRILSGAEPCEQVPLEPETWPEIFPFSPGELPRFPTEVLPSWLSRFVLEVAEATQTPEDLPGVLSLATVSAAVAGRNTIEVQRDWTEPCNLYVVVAELSVWSRKPSPNHRDYR